VRASREEKIIDTLKNGRPRRLYSAWIDAPDPILQKIVKVRYRYDPAKFDPPTREQTTRNNGFMDTYLGIGAVDADMDIDLVLNDGRTVTLKFNMYRTLFGN